MEAVRQIKQSKDCYELALAGLQRPVVVRKTARAQRMTLRVSPVQRDIVLTIPRHAGWRQAGAFVVQHLDWLKQQLDVMPGPVPFEDGAVVPFGGKPHRLCFVGPATAKNRSRGTVWRQRAPVAGELPVLNVVGAPEHAPRRLTDWLKREARVRLTDRAGFHAEQLGLRYSRIGVRDQTSRWGSCSSRGALSFSWRLIFAPPAVLDYVAAHEVAHLREMNHSTRFWQLVEATLPGYLEHRRWLRQNGPELHRYGADV